MKNPSPKSVDPIEAHQLASKFAALIRDCMLPDEVDDVIERNKRSSNPNICHTHDFCDANEVMLAAWRDMTGKVHSMSTDYELWNVAWSIAKGADFMPETIEQLRAALTE